MPKAPFAPAARDTAERRDQDKAMIEHPEWWPHGDRLPVKRPSHFNEERGGFGVIFRNSVVGDEPLTVKLHNLYETSGKAALVYTDVDALLDDGWTVD